MKTLAFVAVLLLTLTPGSFGQKSTGYPAGDGCNTCYHRADGVETCTLLACFPKEKPPIVLTVPPNSDSNDLVDRGPTLDTCIGESCIHLPIPEPMDVPAVEQDATSEIESVGNSDQFRCSNGGHFTGGGIISGQCAGGFTWTCSDKHRIHLIAENGQDHHCILFPRTEPQAELRSEKKLFADGTQPPPQDCRGNPQCHTGRPGPVCCYISGAK